MLRLVKPSVTGREVVVFPNLCVRLRDYLLVLPIPMKQVVLLADADIDAGELLLEVDFIEDLLDHCQRDAPRRVEDSVDNGHDCVGEYAGVEEGDVL